MSRGPWNGVSLLDITIRNNFKSIRWVAINWDVRLYFRKNTDELPPASRQHKDKDGRAEDRTNHTDNHNNNNNNNSNNTEAKPKTTEKADINLANRTRGRGRTDDRGSTLSLAWLRRTQC
jgi:Mg-chelatase subunit ChlI